MVMFFSAHTWHASQRPVLIVVSIMGAFPVACTVALFSAFRTIQEELRETRRELKYWQSMHMYEDSESPSTGIKPAPPSGRP
jgi:hypothetical protein